MSQPARPTLLNRNATLASGAARRISDAMATDIRIGTPRAKVAFLFNKVGLAGCDMGACAILPRIIGQGRASELLYTGRAMTSEEAMQWGFFTRLAEPDAVKSGALMLAREIADGPSFASGLNVDDEILGIDEIRVRADRFDVRLGQYSPGSRITLLVARREELLRIPVTLATTPAPRWRLEMAPGISEAQRRAQTAWLGQ